MTWQAYDVVWRLRAPLHVGRGKVGNVQMARPYVTGRVLWGALTERLVRDAATGPATDSALYKKMGQQVHDHLAFSYLYAALEDANGGYRPQWPWDAKADTSPPPEGELVGKRAFRARFMGSYASTALLYPHNSALEGSLHEVEFLSPRTLDDGGPVYLMGVLLASESAPPGWRDALARLQVGGERGYGWGRLERITCKEMGDKEDENDASPVLFGYELELAHDRPEIIVPANASLLAHTHAENLKADGDVEPLVGRLWGQRGAGQHVDYTGVCYAPGATVNAKVRFKINPFGVWETV